MRQTKSYFPKISFFSHDFSKNDQVILNQLADYYQSWRPADTYSQWSSTNY